MRISSVISPVVAFAALGAAHALAFELKGLNEKTPPAEVLSYGMSQIRNGDTATAVEALNYAAEKGVPGAQWKLGDMYADGDGVPRDDKKAFEFFSEVARHADDDSYDSAPYVSNAFVRLGTYYRDGIADTDVKPDPGRARQFYDYAASVFGNADAQLNLARMYFDGSGGDRDLIKAMKWASHAADKGKKDAKLLLVDIWLTMAQDDLQADPPNPREAAKWARQASNSGSIEGQALLGYILFEGDGVTRQAVDGLTMLTIALERSSGKSNWIRGLHEQARAAASLDEWNAASQRADEWRASNAVATANAPTN